MSPKRSPFTLILAALGVLIGPLAYGAVPDPARSYVDPCLRVCPAGDMVIHVVVRDAANNPQPGALVESDLCACPGIVLCPSLPIGPVVSSCTLVATADAAGVVDFRLRAGTCNGQVTVRADGVLLAIRNAVSSPDQNGDLTVDAVDAAILTGNLGGPYDPTADLNCSGSLEPGDTGVLNAHLGHSCAAVVPVQPRSWGTIKMLYR